LPFPTLIRLRVTVVRSGVSRLITLIVYLVAGIDRDVIPTNVSIDGVVALVLIVRAAAIIVVVVVRIVVHVSWIRPVVGVGVIWRTIVKRRAMIVWAINRTVNVMMDRPRSATVVHAATGTPVWVIVIVTTKHGADRDANTECNDQTRCRLCRRGSNIHLDRIVLRHVDYLRIRRLDHYHLLGASLLRDHRLLRSSLQITSLFRLQPKPLDRVENRALARGERCAKLFGPFNLRTHHVNDLREVK
jgi:hypothetical protein